MSAVMDTRHDKGDGSGKGEERRSRWIPWAFVAFFVVVAAVQGVLVWFALESFSGLTTENAYQRGIAYNRTLAAKAAEMDLGWAVTLAWRPDPALPAKGRLEVEVLDRLGQPLQGAEVKARLRRPVGPESTVEAALEPDAPGRYAAQLTLPLRGQWDVDLDLATAAGTDHLTDRIFAK
jgi:nitrogen fixation protein FixH